MWFVVHQSATAVCPLKGCEVQEPSPVDRSPVNPCAFKDTIINAQRWKCNILLLFRNTFSSLYAVIWHVLKWHTCRHVEISIKNTSRTDISNVTWFINSKIAGFQYCGLQMCNDLQSTWLIHKYLQQILLYVSQYPLSLTTILKVY